MLTEPATNYSVVARQQRASSVVPTSTEHNKQRHHYTWRKSHSAEKYDYRDVNLNSSMPEKINKRIPLPEDYWKVHEQDVKVWKIGTASPPQRPPREKEKDNSDWEYNVKKYENMGDGQRQSRIQYFTGTDDKGNRKNSLEGDRKELKIPGLKTFKSASMRLPGQRTSLHEVLPMLRNKFNKFNVGLRRKRTMSVQEVFQTPSSQQQQDAPSQFYVPSPTAVNKYHDSLVDNDGNGPSSLPYIVNGTQKTSPGNNYNNSGNGSSSCNKKVTASSSLSPTSVKTMSHQNENDHKKSVQRSQSYRSRHHKNNDLKGERSGETASSSSSTPNKQGKTTISSPDFNVGGRVSLREQNNTRTPSMAAKMTNCVKNKMRMRPRSHSPLKTTKGENKLKKNRESFGLFDKINRMMNTHHLPPPHNNNNSHTNNKNHSNNKQINNSPTKNSISIENSVKSSSSSELAANKKESSVTDAAKEKATTTTNNKCDFNQARKPSSQLPETISVRDRKITKQVPAA